MAGYQYTIIIGNVGRDPELRYTQSGARSAIQRGRLARWTDRPTNEHARRRPGAA